MKSRSFSLPRALFAVLTLWALAGCNVIPPVQPDVTRYYVLSGLPVSEWGGQSPTGTLRLGLRTVDVAPYLRKGSLVVRAGGNEVAFASEARWAEPLDQEISASLRQRLAAAPVVARVLVAPFPVEPARDFDVQVQVLHCEGIRDREGRALARFAAVVEISTTGENAQLISRKGFVAPDAMWDGKDYGRLAGLLSDAVSALSREILSSVPEKK